MRSEKKRSVIKRSEVKRTMFAAVLLALIAYGAAVAQNQSQTSAKPDNATVRPAANKTLTVFGRVSSNGRSLVTDLDTEWAVNNAEAFKGREGSLVKVKCYVDPDHAQLHVLSVKSAQPEPRFDPR
jgi:membrane protein implicated in regulation of membrane protease activity